MHVCPYLYIYVYMYGIYLHIYIALSVCLSLRFLPPHLPIYIYIYIFFPLYIYIYMYFFPCTYIYICVYFFPLYIYIYIFPSCVPPLLTSIVGRVSVDASITAPQGMGERWTRQCTGADRHRDRTGMSFVKSRRWCMAAYHRLGPLVHTCITQIDTCIHRYKDTYTDR